MSPLRRWPCAAWPAWRPQYEELFIRLAKETGIYIIGGTHPVFQRGKVFNAAHLFTPNGQVFRQKKVHLTPTESGPYQLSRGHGLYLYHTDFGNIAILICYDVEFPEVARVMAEAGAEILFVPSCTDGREGFCRVRYCAQARAIENQVYVAMTGTVGNLPLVPYMATNYGQAAILTPSDYFFARDGIAAEGTINQEQMVVADVDLDLLDEQRVNGSVIPLQDLIKDAYDNVVHFSDYKNPKRAGDGAGHLSAGSRARSLHGLIADRALRSSRRSDFQEQLPPVHPVQHQPIAEQHRRAFHERLQALPSEGEEVRPQVDMERVDRKLLHKCAIR